MKLSAIILFLLGVSANALQCRRCADLKLITVEDLETDVSEIQPNGSVCDESEDETECDGSCIKIDVHIGEINRYAVQGSVYTSTCVTDGVAKMMPDLDRDTADYWRILGCSLFTQQAEDLLENTFTVEKCITDHFNTFVVEEL